MDSTKKLIWCLIGAVNASLKCEGFPPADVAYSSHNQNLPLCASHAFITWRRVRTVYQGGEAYFDGTLSNLCAIRGVKIFEGIYGRCAPPPPAVRKSNKCGDLFGSCPPCSTTDLDISAKYTADGCKPITVTSEGQIVWPDGMDGPITEDQFSSCLADEIDAIECNLVSSISKCQNSCFMGEDKFLKNNVKLLDTANWCEGPFSGIKLRVVALTG